MNVTRIPAYAVAPPDNIKIEVSLSQAGVLLKICANIGGSPSGPRGVADELAIALRAANVIVPDDVTRIGPGLTIESVKFYG